MARCQSVQKLLWDYRDGDLKPRESERVQKHLAACSRCQATLKSIEALHDAMSPFAQEPVRPPSLNAESVFQNVLALSSASPKHPYFTTRRAGWAMCCVLLLAAGLRLRTSPVQTSQNAPKTEIAQAPPTPGIAPYTTERPPKEGALPKQSAPSASAHYGLKNTRRKIETAQLAATPLRSQYATANAAKPQAPPLSYIRARAYEDQPDGETRWNEWSVVEQGGKRLVSSETSYDSKTNSALICEARAPNVRVTP